MADLPVVGESVPHEFKLAYGPGMMQLGEDVVEEIAKRHGTVGLIRLVADIAIRVPLEYLSEMRGDMRYGLRALIKSPGFALVGIISMGLGIGLTTNVYSSKWALLFRDLPAAANAKKLVMPEKPVSYYYGTRVGTTEDRWPQAQFIAELRDGLLVQQMPPQNGDFL